MMFPLPLCSWFECLHYQRYLKTLIYCINTREYCLNAMPTHPDLRPRLLSIITTIRDRRSLTLDGRILFWLPTLLYPDIYVHDGFYWNFLGKSLILIEFIVAKNRLTDKRRYKFNTSIFSTIMCVSNYIFFFYLYNLYFLQSSKTRIPPAHPWTPRLLLSLIFFGHSCY